MPAPTLEQKHLQWLTEATTMQYRAAHDSWRWVCRNPCKPIRYSPTFFPTKEEASADYAAHRTTHPRKKGLDKAQH